MLRIEPALLLEGGYREIVEACPGILPSFEVSHPIRNIDVNPINPRRRNLPHPLHVDRPPLASVRTHPDILVAFSNPECGASAENRRLAVNLALQPVRLILRHRVRRLVAVRGDALGSSNVDEGRIAHLM